MEEQVRASPDLALDRSKIVNVVTNAFFESGLNHRSKTGELVITNRTGHQHLYPVQDVRNPEIEPVMMVRS